MFDLVHEVRGETADLTVDALHGDRSDLLSLRLGVDRESGARRCAGSYRTCSRPTFELEATGSGARRDARRRL